MEVRPIEGDALLCEPEKKAVNNLKYFPNYLSSSSLIICHHCNVRSLIPNLNVSLSYNLRTLFIDNHHIMSVLAG